MSYNGSGTFNINTAGQPVVTGTVISSTAFNALTADLATGLSTAITKDGQTAATARIPFAQGISSTLVTDSTSTTTGSIITAGGAGVAKALFVGTTANVAGTTDSSSSTTGAITTAGGVGIAKALNVGTTLAVAGNSTFTGSVNAPNTFGFKNRIINGAMVIDQRNAGASVTLSSASSSYGLDRFLTVNATDGTITYQQVVDAPSGFYNSTKLTVTTADASLSAAQTFRYIQRIEANNLADFNLGTASANTFTVSFWVKSSLTGTFAFAVNNYNVSDQSYVTSYTINSANTWEQKFITITAPTTGTFNTGTNVGLEVVWGLGVGTNFNTATQNQWVAANVYSFLGATSVVGTLNATWNITGVQLEKGSQATSFDFRSIGTELVLCRRYFQLLQAGIGTNNTTTSIARLTWPMVVSLRASPTIAAVGTPTFFDGSSTITHTSVGANYSTATSCQVDDNVTSASATTGKCNVQANSASAYFTATSEL